MTKFEENAVLKQDESFSEKFAVRAFEYSCTLCCERNLDCYRHGCANCPVKEAHVRALTEIRSSKRSKSESFHYGASKFNSKHGTTTVYYNFNNCIVNITKEEKK